MRILAICCCVWVACATGRAAAQGYELQPGVNHAGVIEYPTALDQYTPNTVHGTVEIVDLAEPDLALPNLRYGRQIGALQLLADAYARTEPEREFERVEVRAKLRVFTFAPERTSVALGALARFPNDDEAEQRIDERPASLLGIVTSELFPLSGWGGFLVNLYLDNRVGVLGLKTQVFPRVKAVGELDYFHSPTYDLDRYQHKLGIELEGENSFYFQVYWADVTGEFRAQVGVGF